MQLNEFLEGELILPDLTARDKAGVLEELVTPLGHKWPQLDLESAKAVLLEREGLGSTGIGDGIAIPHGKLDVLDEVSVVVGRSLPGVEFDALDQKPCHIFFLVMAPEHVAGMHLRILATISRTLKDEVFRQSFMQAEGKEGLWQLLQAT
ncbi:PTS sugar transporter subunit IIA [Desulfohalobium retbaense]|uniref:PTS IIA-like nitrogen-regulatory protein PtsN n=1 Tax=Desulfohalobium retbaense (strain ATCC 49708 / DSM 5692 / JCM 16813 / HR100) TaxID=485915 RepID=C8X386_DESRD|nr:PTS sugar transporter subunit IIA [Desulfohalobium retbaense]ACV68883.1 putative PTS IIA-like nitrogen-regulatory protein PtsN [Desulfohalobium retbaense DSM 5692]